MGSRGRVVLCFIIFVFLASCASAPEAALYDRESSDVLAMLPAGAKVYLRIDAVEGRPLLDVLSFEGIKGNDLSDILDSTDLAAAAIFPEGEGRRFFLAASGAFPRAKANFSLTFAKGWKKQKSKDGNSYWYSQKEQIALSLGNRLALVSDTDPFEKFPLEIPSGEFIDFSRPLALSLWMSKPSETINSFLEFLGVPLQVPAEEFFFGAERVPPGEDAAPWQLIFRIKTASAAQARSLVTLFSFARLFIARPPENANYMTMSPMEAVALLFANNPEQNGDVLILRTNPLHENTIALLFEIFSIYSN